MSTRQTELWVYPAPAGEHRGHHRLQGRGDRRVDREDRPGHLRDGRQLRRRGHGPLDLRHEGRAPRRGHRPRRSERGDGLRQSHEGRDQERARVRRQPLRQVVPRQARTYYGPGGGQAGPPRSGRAAGDGRLAREVMVEEPEARRWPARPCPHGERHLQGRAEVDARRRRRRSGAIAKARSRAIAGDPSRAIRIGSAGAAAGRPQRRCQPKPRAGLEPATLRLTARPRRKPGRARIPLVRRDVLPHLGAGKRGD